MASGIGGGLLQKVNIDMSKGTVDFAKDATRHVKGTLPPSLSGIADDSATVRYFLKVTVNRPKFYKTNLRHHDPFVFLPLEPPRPPPTSLESYARKKHEFFVAGPPKKSGGFFGGFRRDNTVPPVIPVRFAVDARLPSPPIVVPGEPLGLRILLTKLDPFAEVVLLRSLQITLLGTTHITAHELVKDQLSTNLLLSVADLHMPFGDANSPVNETIEADPAIWRMGGGGAQFPLGHLRRHVRFRRATGQCRAEGGRPC